MLNRFYGQALNARWFFGATVLLAILLVAPSITAGLGADDYVHFASLRTQLFPKVNDWSLFGLFTFTDGDPVRNSWLRDFGTFPWWAALDGKLSLWRPLSELTHYADYMWWPDAPLLMHLQSVAWYAAAVVAAFLAYRRLIHPAAAASLAAFLFAVDHAHAIPVLALCNRNALIALVFGLMTLHQHDRWRKDGQALSGWLAALFYAACLGAGEIGLAISGYLFAYTLFMERNQSWRRWNALLPYLMFGIAWVVFYKAGGFGARGNATYIDPVTQPLSFLAAMIERAPVLLFSQFALPPADVYILTVFQGVEWVLVGLALVFLALFAKVLWPLLKQSASARFWALGMLIALIPVSAATPSDRLLVMVGIGANGLLAELLYGYWQQKQGQGQGAAIFSDRFLSKAMVNSLAVLNIFISPLLLALAVIAGNGLEQSMTKAPAMNISADETDRQKTWVFVNTSNYYATLILPLVRVANGAIIPERVRILSTWDGAYQLTATSPSEVLMQSETAFLFNVPKGPEQSFTAGTSYKISGMEARIEATGTRQNPTAVRFSFDRPLNSPSLRWFVWKDGKYVDFDPATLPVK